MTARGDETRARILSSALELFAERGFYGATMPDLAKRAGLGAASLYRHFVSKEELVRTVYAQAVERFAGALWQGFTEAGVTRRDMQAVWKRLVQIVAEQPALVLFLEMHYHGAFLGEALQDDAREPAYERLFALVVAGQRREELRSGDPGLIVTYIAAVFFGMVRACVRNGRLADRKRLEDTELLVWSAIAAPGSRR